MLDKIVKRTFWKEFSRLFLFLLAPLPLINILGNVLPSFMGLKVNYYYISILSILIIINSLRYFGNYVILLVIMCSFIFHYTFEVKLFWEFLFGILLLNNYLDYTESIQDQFYFFLVCLSIPMFVSMLQFFGLIPLTLLNFDYVNTGINVFGEAVQRVNGYYYHAIELVLPTLFLSIFLFFRFRYKMVYYFIFLLPFIYITTIKTGLAILIGIFLIFFFDKSYKLMASKKVLLVNVIAVLLLILSLFISGIIQNGLFTREFLTGRGIIWNTYLAGMTEYNITNYIAGIGYGARTLVFENGVAKLGAFIREGTPHEHNILLSIILNGGVIYFSIIIYVLVKVYRKLRSNSRTLKVFISLMLIMWGLGMTHPLNDMSIFWVSFLFIFLYAKTHNSLIKKKYVFRQISS